MLFNNLSKKGLTLPEVLTSVSILSVVVLATATTQINAYRITERNKDKIFAGQKAIQILDELRSIVNGGEEYKLQDLDSKDDGTNYNPILTTESFPDSMGVESRALSSLSRNAKKNGHWKFIRNVDIRRNSIDAKSRDVTVSIFYENEDGIAVKPALASLSAILKTSSNPNIPFQKIDAYGVAIANQSAWWADLGTLKSSMIDYAYDLSSRNLGLDFQMHYITMSSFGRDPFYTPYINKVGYINNDPNLKYPYFYAGRYVSTGPSLTGNEFYYYPVEEMEQSGMRLNIDGVRSNNWPFINATSSDQTSIFSFSPADQYNHSVRYPEEININDKFKKFKTDSNQLWEPTYRVFLEKMISTSEYKDSLIANLHGELLPSIPMRNYSDPAKMVDTLDTNKLSTFRVVTHPEFLNYKLDESPTGKKDTNVVLRVYPYLNNPSVTGDTIIDKINIFIPTTNIVGGNENNTTSQVDSTDKMPLFLLDSTASTLKKIKDNITVSYINNDVSGNYERVTSNLKGKFSIKLSSSSVIAAPTGTNPIVIRKGTKLIEDGGNNITFYTTKDVSLTSKNTFFDVEVSAKGWFNSSPIITGTLKLSLDNSIGKIINNSTNISYGSSDFAVQNTATPFTLDTTSNAKGKYNITVNPVFDRYGTGKKTPVPGILITLYNTEAKNTQLTSNKGGIPSNRRLYGKDYIPTPLGYRMFPVGTESSAPSNKYPQNGGSTYNSYNWELMGRDLDEVGTNANNTKNSARWIIKLNLGQKDSSNESPCDISNPDLTCFQDKMMVVDTRMSNDMSSDNLTSGLSMNHTVNTKDGNMVPVSSISEKIQGSSIDDSNISIIDPDAYSSITPEESANNDYWKRELSNLSRTYTWIGNDKNLVPYTERFQIVGDPRYNPYIDTLQENKINLTYNSSNTAATLTSASHISRADTWFPCFTNDLTSVNNTLLPKWLSENNK